MVYFSIKSFEGRSSLYTWLHRITVNKCYEFLRKKRLTASLDTSLESEDDPARTKLPADPSPASDTLVVQREFLNKLLLRIPEQDRHLLLLRELEGFSIAELSEARWPSSRTARSWLQGTCELTRTMRFASWCAHESCPRKRSQGLRSG